MLQPLVLDFERPVVEIERKIAELRGLASSSQELAAELERLERRAAELRQSIYGRLTAWQQVQIARHPGRPRPAAVVKAAVTEFVELRGDRASGDDPGILAGVGYLGRGRVAVVCHGRGRPVSGDRTWSAAPTPAGIRKALRVAELAARFDLPLIVVVDTPGEWGRGEASGAGDRAERTVHGPALVELMSVLLEMPQGIVTLLLGESFGSAAAPFLAAERVLVMEHAVLGPVSPEEAALRDYGDPTRAPDVAEAMGLTAEDALTLGAADEKVVEPEGGAHRDPEAFLAGIAQRLRREAAASQALDHEARSLARRRRLQTLAGLGSE